MCKTIQIKYCPYITLLKELLGSMKCEVYKHFTPSGVKTGCAIFRARAVFHLAYERSASDLHLVVGTALRLSGVFCDALWS